MTTRHGPYATILGTALFAAACGGGLNPYAGMLPEEIFEIALVEFEEGDHNNAIRALDRLLISYGDWARVPDARLLLANVYFDDEQYLTARAEYQRFLDRHSGHPSTPDAALGICRSLAALSPVPQRDQQYTVEAIQQCRNVTVDYAGLSQATEANEHSARLRGTLAEKEFNDGEFYFKRKLDDSAIVYYQFVVDGFPETEWAPRALLGIVRSNMRIGYTDLADDAKNQLLNRYPNSDAAAEARQIDTGGPGS